MLVVVIYIILIVVYGLIKKVNSFESFERGVENNYGTLLKLFPNLLMLILGINIFIHSGILDILKNILPQSFFIVPEIIMQALLKPLSSSSAMLMMIKTFETYGVDSVMGKVSSIIQGCSDTTIYIVVVYFSSIKMTNSKYALKAGLLTDFLTFILTFIICYFLFQT